MCVCPFVLLLLLTVGSTYEKFHPQQQKIPTVVLCFTDLEGTKSSTLYLGGMAPELSFKSLGLFYLLPALFGFTPISANASERRVTWCHALARRF